MAQHYFAARLRELREARGWSQQELADRAGLHLMTVSRFERDTLKPTWIIALTLAEVLGVDCRAFCEEPKTQPEKRARTSPEATGRGGPVAYRGVAPTAAQAEGAEDASAAGRVNLPELAITGEGEST
jgi:transcriptional regulator with XRE-family HTH domain